MDRIGRYHLTSVIGIGGFGTVHAALDPDSGQRVAVKVLRLPGDGQLRAMFRSEIAAMLSVDHPNVVRVLDVIDTDETAALVTDFVDGVSLRQALRERGPLDGRQALVVLSGALQGLVAVHEAGLVHADLKPDNILLDSTGTSRLIDFGLAGPPRLLDGPDTWSGTPAYISPEQVAGHHIDVRSDIYSMAVVLFELLCGRTPYNAESAELTAHLHLSAPVPDPRTWVPDLSEGLASICLIDLDKDPARRHQNAAAFHTSLDHAARQRYGPGWATGVGLSGVVGGLIAALPVGSGLLGGGAAGGAAGVAAVGAAGSAVGGIGTLGGAAGGSAGGTGVAGSTGAVGMAGGTSSSNAGLLGGLAGAKGAIAGVATLAIVGAGAGGAYLATRDHESAQPAAAATHDVFAYRTTTAVVVVKDGQQVTRLPLDDTQQQGNGQLNDPATAWSQDGARFALVDGTSLSLVDLDDGSTTTQPCSRCSSVTLWDDRVVTVVGADHPARPTLVSRPLRDPSADPTPVITDPPSWMSWYAVDVVGDDLLVTGNNDEESGAHGTADAYLVDRSGTATRVGEQTLFNYVSSVTSAPETAYGGPRAALAIAGSGGACTIGMQVSLVDPTDTTTLVETDGSQMFPEPTTSMYLESIHDLWFGSDGHLRASAHRSTCDWDAGAGPDRPIQQWRLDQQTWVLEDTRPVLGARDLPTGAHLELVADEADPTEVLPTGTLSLIDGGTTTEVATDVASISSPPPALVRATPTTPAAAAPLTEAQANQLLIPDETCGDGVTDGWNQTEAIQLVDGAGEKFASDISVGAAIHGTTFVGTVDITGDPTQEVVLMLACSGSPAELCCAGRGSTMNAVAVLDVSGTTPQRVGSTIWETDEGDSTRQIQAARIEGTSIVTSERFLYDQDLETYGDQPTEFRHTFDGTDWS